MTVNAIQKPTAAYLRQTIKSVSSQITQANNRYANMVEILDSWDSADLTSIGITDASEKTLIADFRISLSAMVTAYNVQAATFDKLRDMIP